MGSLNPLGRTASGGPYATGIGTDPGASWRAAMRAAHQAGDYQVQDGDTLTAIAARYGMSARDLEDANPSLQDPNSILPGQRLHIPADRGTGAPTRHTVRPGETLSGIAADAHTSLVQLAQANGIANPDHIHAGQELYIPSGRYDAPPHTDHAKADVAAAPPATGQAAPASSPTPPGGAAAGSRMPGAVTTAPAAPTSPTSMPTAEAEPKPATSAAPSATTAAPPATAQTNAAASAAPDPALDAQTILAAAGRDGDPEGALEQLNADFAKAAPAVRAAILADLRAGQMLDQAAHQATQKLASTNGGLFPEAKTGETVSQLDRMAEKLDPALAGALANRAVPAFEAFQKAPENGGRSLFGSQGMTALMHLGGKIGATPQGEAALASFARLGAWNNEAVRNAIGGGGDPAYAIALGRQMKAAGQDPGVVTRTITDGIAQRDGASIAAGGSPAPVEDVASRMTQAGLDAGGVRKVSENGVSQFSQKVAGDVGKLAQHEAELAWLVKQGEGGLMPAQLGGAIAGYRAQKGADWRQADETLRGRVSDDGAKLLAQMTALHGAGPQGSDGTAETLTKIANDPAAGAAISTALRTDPNLASPAMAEQLAGLFARAKLGDIGRRFGNELAAAYVRKNVLQKLKGLDLTRPADVGLARGAIASLGDGTFAKLIGVTPADTKKAVAALDEAAAKAAAGPGSADAALGELDRRLNSDASLAKAFNKTTVPGQLLRGIGVAFAGVSLLNSGTKFAGQPTDPQNGIKLLTDASGFAQKSAELLVGLGAINKDSALGQFGGEWKLAGRASAGDLISGISATLDAVSAVRSGFGLGVKQDTGSAIGSGVSAAGGFMAVAPAFGADAAFGPIGLVVAAAGVVGNAAYQDVKNAHQYEAGGEAFLKGAGFAPAAAAALSKQGGVTSGASGASQLPFLVKYAAMRHLPPDQVQRWVGGLTPDQVRTLSQCLLQTAGDSHGDPSRFTDGPPQTAAIPGSEGVGEPFVLANTLGQLEANLKASHVPLP